MRITAGKWRGRNVDTPKGAHTRPTPSLVREAIFNICGDAVIHADVLDLFAGSGIMSLEALSRGAASATLIDNNQNAKRSILKNIREFDIQNEAAFLFGNVFDRLKRLEGKTFDVIYADPPYNCGFGEKLLLYLDQSSLLKKGGLLFLEEGQSLQIELETLVLKDCRSYGRTKLHRYTQTKIFYS